MDWPARCRCIPPTSQLPWLDTRPSEALMANVWWRGVARSAPGWATWTTPRLTTTVGKNDLFGNLARLEKSHYLMRDFRAPFSTPMQNFARAAAWEDRMLCAIVCRNGWLAATNPILPERGRHAYSIRHMRERTSAPLGTPRCASFGALLGQSHLGRLAHPPFPAKHIDTLRSARLWIVGSRRQRYI